MKLILLDGPRSPHAAMHPNYRGTYRSHPSHCDALPEDHEINRLFYWFLGEGGELGVVQDLQKALRFAELWNSRLPQPERFDVIEVTDGNELPERGDRFLGYDLSAGYNNSLLWWQLQPSKGVADTAQPIRDEYYMLCRQYAPQLNDQGLFRTSDVASMCLKAMIALQDRCPNLFEGGNLGHFQVVGLYLVST